MKTMRRFLHHFRDLIITFLMILAVVYFGMIAMSESLHTTSNLDKNVAQSKWEIGK